MLEREVMLLKVLSSQDDWVTSFSLSALLNISVRTVKSYISSINDQKPHLIESSRKGYRVQNKELLTEILIAKETPSPPQTGDDRRKYILCKLLLETPKYDLDILASELAISPITLTNELAKLKEELEDYDLTIRTKHNRVFIEGHEKDKKKILSKLIYEDSESSFLSVTIMQNYLPHFDLIKVREIIQDSLRNHNYFMDDFSLHNLVLQIAITMERKVLVKDYEEHNPSDWRGLADAHIQRIVLEITDEIQKQFSIIFTNSEIYDFTILIMTRVISHSINELNLKQLKQFVGNDIIQLVSLIQTRIKETYNISLTLKPFTVRFTLHLKNLLIRLKHGVTLSNPQMLTIKNSYPFIYEVSVFIANIINKKTGFTLSEDEISYIALHVGVVIEERKSIKHEVRAILLAPNYSIGSMNLAERLTNAFKGNILLTAIVSNQHELKGYSDYDMIISTIPLIPYPGKPWVLISVYLNNKDTLAVSEKLEEVLKDRIKAKVQSKLTTMFKDELFFVDTNFKDAKEAIETMAEALEKYGYVGNSFKDKIFEREAISSSAYLNIAMPHPLEMSAFGTAIAVSLHPKPIQWNNNRVNIVFMLAINPTDRLLYRDIFDFVTEVISEEKNLKTLLEIKSYDEFIVTLASFAE